MSVSNEDVGVTTGEDSLTAIRARANLGVVFLHLDCWGVRCLLDEQFGCAKDITRSVIILTQSFMSSRTHVVHLSKKQMRSEHGLGKNAEVPGSRKVVKRIGSIKSIRCWLLTAFCGSCVAYGCHNEDNLKYATELAQSKDVLDRRASVFELEKNNNPSAHAALRRLAGDSDPEIRGLAIRALGKTGDRQSLDVLLNALSDEAMFSYCERSGLALCRYRIPICQAADESLRRITTKDAGFNPSDNLEERRAAIARWRSIVTECQMHSL